MNKNYFRVYVAGAYTPTGNGNHAIEMLNNMREGIRAAVELLVAGYVPYCPWLDWQYYMQVNDMYEITGDMIKDNSMAFLETSDAIVILPNWERSTGTGAELVRANELGIPIYFGLQDFFNETYELDFLTTDEIIKEIQSYE